MWRIWKPECFRPWSLLIESIIIKTIWHLSCYLKYNCNWYIWNEKYDNSSHLFVFLPTGPSWTLNVVLSTNASEFRTQQRINFHIRFRCSHAFLHAYQVVWRRVDNNALTNVNRTVDKLLTEVYFALVEIVDWARCRFWNEELKWKLAVMLMSIKKDAFSDSVRGFFFFFHVLLKDGLTICWSSRSFREKEEQLH